MLFAVLDDPFLEEWLVFVQLYTLLWRKTTKLDCCWLAYHLTEYKNGGKTAKKL